MAELVLLHELIAQSEVLEVSATLKRWLPPLAGWSGPWYGEEARVLGATNEGALRSE